MTGFEAKRGEWNKQAQSTSDRGAQVARPSNPNDLDLLVWDIRRKLQVCAASGAILDVGCGNGMVLSRLAGGFDRICGVDYADAMTAESKTLVPGGQFVVGEAGALAFDDNSFARVLCYSIFHYFPDNGYAKRALSELVRVCEPGGVVLIGDLLDGKFEHDIKSSSNLEYEQQIPSIHRYSEWRFYDLEWLAGQVPGRAKAVEILTQPTGLALHKYRKDLRICL